MLFDLNSPVTYQKWVMAAMMDPLGIQGGTLLASMSVHTPSILTRLVQRCRLDPVGFIVPPEIINLGARGGKTELTTSNG